MRTKTMALDLALENIRVNAVTLGAIEPDMNQELKENNAKLNKVLSIIPLRRIRAP
jgi:NAD(P)-dependent dehydrogenase (short-subunit alcohol dehydrogenase family)